MNHQDEFFKLAEAVYALTVDKPWRCGSPFVGLWPMNRRLAGSSPYWGLSEPVVLSGVSFSLCVWFTEPERPWEHTVTLFVNGVVTNPGGQYSGRWTFFGWLFARTWSEVLAERIRDCVHVWKAETMFPQTLGPSALREAQTVLSSKHDSGETSHGKLSLAAADVLSSDPTRDTPTHRPNPSGEPR